MVFIECMACGTPTIGAKSGGPTEFVKPVPWWLETGWRPDGKGWLENGWLGGGFKYFLFSSLFGEMIQFD